MIALNRRGKVLLLAEGRQHLAHARRQIGGGKGVAQHRLDRDRPLFGQRMIGMADEKAALRAERLHAQLRVELGLPAVGNHKRVELRGQRLMQRQPVINLKAHPRLRQKAMKLADGGRNQPCGRGRAAAKSDLAVLRIVRFAQLAAELHVQLLKAAGVGQQLLPVQGERR